MVKSVITPFQNALKSIVNVDKKDLIMEAEVEVLTMRIPHIVV